MIGRIKKVWEMHTNMTEQEFTLFVDELLQEGGSRLDSLDAGDALFALFEIAEGEEWAGDLEFNNTFWRWISPMGKYIVVFNEWATPFEWEGI